MRQDLLEVWKILWVRLAVYALLAYLLLQALFLLLGGARGALVTLALASAFAYLAAPIVRALERWRVPRGVGVGLVYVGVGLFLGLSSYLIADMVGVLARFSAELPRLLQPWLAWIDNLPSRVGQVEIPPALEGVFSQVAQSLQTLLQGFTQTLLQALQALLVQGGSLVGFLASLVGGVLQFFAALIISIYLLYDLPKISSTLLGAVPLPYQSLALDLALKLDRAVGGYLRGQIVVAACVGLLVALGFWAFGVPMAGALGFLAGVFNIIPYVGVVISTVPAVLLALSAGGWPQVLAVLAVVVLANQVEAHLLGPRILGQATSLHPVSVIAALLIGSSLYGLVGALLAVPLAAFLKLLYVEFYQKSRFYLEG
ncbi:MAG: AI-2E family transporter [Meiothermus sp.]|uniref:AI-2E family transporter n=1 Tax=Meiothermus sp. TaxID=1955249 RepID=UPI0025E1DA29|nr:AI-2E family transporter [Meiothermus sp.]MCS7057914.1 AI-2E family transporter [Meiothermus sp.]MCS7194210.1 AI-2E family transporter [Meiothermus sp.]MCX7741159.1 AI-2E family transporter [Meiothermus sp.]MDW8090071.1 AI-2E family transporter [Meiothermus sp.]MDW8480719.1 AI-2E family transporter [Meiothermus sp.]